MEPCWLVEARRQIGVKEWPGREHNPKVVGYFKRAGFGGIRDDETPWCAAFVNAVLKSSGLIGSNSLLARSFLEWGQEIDEPRVGAIAVFTRGKSAWQGHVGFVISSSARQIELLGGNQSNAVTIAPYPSSKLLGFRWPSALRAEAMR